MVSRKTNLGHDTELILKFLNKIRVVETRKCVLIIVADIVDKQADQKGYLFLLWDKNVLISFVKRELILKTLLTEMNKNYNTYLSMMQMRNDYTRYQGCYIKRIGLENILFFGLRRLRLS